MPGAHGNFSKVDEIAGFSLWQNKQGQFVSHIVNDAQVFAEGFKSLMGLVREPLKAGVYLGMAFWADWALTSVMLVVGPFFVLVLMVSARKIRNNQWEVQREYGELTHHVSESLSGGKIIKAFNLEEFAGKRFGTSQDDFFNKQMKTTLVEEMAHPFVELLGAVAFSGVVVFAHYRMADGAVSTGGFCRLYHRLGPVHAADSILFSGERETGTGGSGRKEDSGRDGLERRAWR